MSMTKWTWHFNQSQVHGTTARGESKNVMRNANATNKKDNTKMWSSGEIYDIGVQICKSKSWRFSEEVLLYVRIDNKGEKSGRDIYWRNWWKNEMDGDGWKWFASENSC